jgi:hypothetical protein
MMVGLRILVSEDEIASHIKGGGIDRCAGEAWSRPYV